MVDQKNIPAPDYWMKPRIVNIVTDENSWFVPFAEKLFSTLKKEGDLPNLVYDFEDIQPSGITFLLSVTRIVPLDILDRSYRNFVVHASNLPQGRGFSPLVWQILEGKNKIPICLLEAADGVDQGNVVLRDEMVFEGHELNDTLREVMGLKQIEMCLKFLKLPFPNGGEPQIGEPNYYKRRTPKDSQVDPERSILDQFNLLRTVDNERYPAFFELHGCTYRLKIEKVDQ